MYSITVNAMKEQRQSLRKLVVGLPPIIAKEVEMCRKEEISRLKVVSTLRKGADVLLREDVRTELAHSLLNIWSITRMLRYIKEGICDANRRLCQSLRSSAGQEEEVGSMKDFILSIPDWSNNVVVVERMLRQDSPFRKHLLARCLLPKTCCSFDNLDSSILKRVVEEVSRSTTLPQEAVKDVLYYMIIGMSKSETLADVKKSKSFERKLRNARYKTNSLLYELEKRRLYNHKSLLDTMESCMERVYFRSNLNKHGVLRGGDSMRELIRVVGSVENLHSILDALPNAVRAKACSHILPTLHVDENITKHTSTTDDPVTLYGDADLRGLVLAFKQVAANAAERARAANELKCNKLRRDAETTHASGLVLLDKLKKMEEKVIEDTLKLRFVRPCTLDDENLYGVPINVPQCNIIYDTGRILVIMGDRKDIIMSVQEETGIVMSCKRNDAALDLVRLLQVMQDGDVSDIYKRVITLTTSCMFCGRELNTDKSIKQGTGDVCKAKYGDAIAAACTEHRDIALRRLNEMQLPQEAAAFVISNYVHELLGKANVAQAPPHAVWLVSALSGLPEQSLLVQTLKELVEAQDEEEDEWTLKFTRLMNALAQVTGIKDGPQAEQACKDLARMHASKGAWVPAVIGDTQFHRFLNACKLADHVGGYQKLVHWIIIHMDQIMNSFAKINVNIYRDICE